MVLRVFLVDDHEIVRTGLRSMLEADGDIEVVGEAGTAAEATTRGSPRPGRRGARHPAPRWRRDRGLPGVALSAAELQCLMSDLVRGRRGALRRHHGWGVRLCPQADQGADLVDAVRRVGRGESLIDPSMTKRVFDRLRDGPVRDERLDRLSDQEHRVLDLVAEGLTNRQIADRLYLAEKTVKNYVSSMLSKLGMDRRSEAAAYAARLSERDSAREAARRADGGGFGIRP